MIAVLIRFGFCLKYIKLIKISYGLPTSKLKLDGTFALTFPLFRGTR